MCASDEVSVNTTNRWNTGKDKCNILLYSSPRLAMSFPRLTMSWPRVTMSSPRFSMSFPRVSMLYHECSSRGRYHDTVGIMPFTQTTNSWGRVKNDL